MKKTDARKRVARALVRVFFRDLYSLVELDNSDKVEDEKRGIENDMANGISRSDKDHSNISFPSPINQKDRENQKKHGVSFEEAKSVFCDKVVKIPP